MRARVEPRGRGKRPSFQPSATAPWHRLPAFPPDLPACSSCARSTACLPSLGPGRGLEWVTLVALARHTVVSRSAQWRWGRGTVGQQDRLQVGDPVRRACVATSAALRFALEWRVAC